MALVTPGPAHLPAQNFASQRSFSHLKDKILNVVDEQYCNVTWQALLAINNAKCNYPTVQKEFMLCKISCANNIPSRIN